MKLDEKKENAEQIGCLIKTKFSEHVDFYNNSFHIEDGLLENLAINVTSDCFNDAEGDDFGCMHFYNIFSCVKKYVVKGMEECEKRTMIVYVCSPESVSKKEDVKSAIKCVYEQMNFFNGTYFDPTIMSNYFYELVPPEKGKFLKGIMESCYEKQKEAFTGVYDGNYFFKYSSCLLVSFLKGLLDMAEYPPKVKGFTFDL